ncbi:MAG: Exodeoxyribonuclease [Eubacteriales bacterium SKADARSKE-1]|nr:Exodeoxyribonuclease [Eubacteriales bacterium SKADARSKE-1]
MKFISWNVNGLRACINKNFFDVFHNADADFFCLQEIKMQENQVEIDTPGYYQYWNSAVKKGYSGTAIFTKHKPLNVTFDLGLEKHNLEGRVITLEMNDFYLVNCYTPNSKRELLRLDYRLEWEDDFRSYLKRLDLQKPIILCGDLNVAHKEIDLKNPNNNHKNAGFTDEERAKMTELLSSGFTDTFRYLYPNKITYTWWSYMFNARKNNAGWRIDYFIVSNRIKDKVIDSVIHDDVMGSDHCPVELILK